MANATTISSSGQSHQCPELRVVLIGPRESKGGKSSTGNFILGQNVFDTSIRTARSEVRQREVHGRLVTVVDTPGWWWGYTREHTPKLDKREIQLSVHLCPPGPHAFLLIIPVDLYLSQVVKRSLKEHLKLFKADVFSHTIVVFIALTPCSDKNLESKIVQAQMSPTLQWILQECGDRKHVLSINNTEDSTQVMKLFEKIEAMLADNGGRLYSVDNAHGNSLREEIQALAEKASRRFDQVQKQRRKLKGLIEGGKTPPELLRLVIVGAQWAARSSAGNTILGKNAFGVNNGGKRTVCCEISHGVVAGRRLMVIDSPGWYYDHTLQDTSEIDKLEIEKSMYICPPGPHAVLLVIVLATAINTSYTRTVQEHMSLFPDDVWKHTVILFTRGDWLGVKTVEERIESEKGLQRLVSKCGNRYHVLNNMNRNDTDQVKELLEKIDEMLAGNEHPYYKVDESRGTQLEAKREAGVKKARRLRKINERQSRIVKELFEGERQPVSDIRLVLLGQTFSGKSTVGNIILLNEIFDLGFGTHPLKKDVQGQRATCVKHEGNFNKVKITVVEAPGWSTDTTVPDWLKGEVLHGVSMCSPGPHVFLLVVPISKAFTENDHKAVNKLLKLFNEGVWRHCMVLFTWGDWLNKRPVEDHIAREGKALQELIEKCGNRYHVLTKNSFGDPVPVKGLLQKVIDIITRNKGCFTTEGKQRKNYFLPWQRKQPTLTEEEWTQREQTLIDRMLKALANEPDEQTLPSVKVANSMDGAFIPSMSGDVASDYGSMSEFGNQRAHDNVADWLRNQVGRSDLTSGIGSICFSTTYMERFDENPPIDENLPKSSPFPKQEEVFIPQKKAVASSAEIPRRYSC